jgi:glyoxylase-like metal-dependent hydrolase (beta-lactamase superfamily II)
MDALKTTQLHENVWVLDEVGKTNMYLVKGSRKALLIDTGFGLADLKCEIGALVGDLPIIVVNTHAHADHNSGNNQFDEIFVGKWDEPASWKELDIAGKERISAGFFTHLEEKAILDWNPGSCKKNSPLADGDSIDLGGCRFDVIETPGHSLGSICLFERTQGWLFTGDLVLAWEVWGQLESSACLRYYSNSLDSLEGLMPLVKCVYPAHGKDEGNPPGCSHYMLPPETLAVYAEGAREIMRGQASGFPYESFGGPGLCVSFSIGGMVYNPRRM